MRLDAARLPTIARYSSRPELDKLRVAVTHDIQDTDRSAFVALTNKPLDVMFSPEGARTLQIKYGGDIVEPVRARSGPSAFTRPWNE